MCDVTRDLHTPPFFETDTFSQNPPSPLCTARCTTFAYVYLSDWNCLSHSLHLELLSHISCRRDDL